MEKDIEVSLHLREEGSCGPKSLCDKNSMLVLALDLTLDLVKPFRDFHWVHQLPPPHSLSWSNQPTVELC
jgi:hypothetical protein